MGLALTGKVVPYKAGFGPFPAEVYHAPFPSALHGVSVADSLRAIEHLFKADVEPQRLFLSRRRHRHAQHTAIERARK